MRTSLGNTDYIVTAESEPDYDSWGPDDYWSCTNWIEYHMSLKEKYTLKEANIRWLKAWDRQDGFEHNYNWCKYDPNFNSYFKSQGIDIGNIFSSAAMAAQNVGNAASDTTDTLAKLLKIAIPVGAVIGSVWIYKTVFK